ncbi:MAG: toll/interleukin-1 receptor domain-containing protein [Bryobacteraceae bacterium]
MPVATHTTPLIFIVYQKTDVSLAEALKRLLEQHGGFKAFYCRQQDREHATKEGYRDYLRETLKTADLVIFLLSSEFRHSPYCQVEAGMTVVLDKPYLEILIPPVDYRDIAKISPILEGRDVVKASDPRTFVTTLEDSLLSHFRQKLPDGPKAINDAPDPVLVIQKTLADLIESYQLRPPEQELMGIFPSLKNDSPAPLSIIEHLRRSIKGGSTHLSVVGVSLKFSLDLITTALEGLPKRHGGTQKKLTINLVHMDDQSHILHSLSDTIDIRKIRRTFHKDWPTVQENWQRACADAGVDLIVNPPKGIDYIPPQVGILIESAAGQSEFYAGRCSFERAGDDFRLIVGEGQYFFYTSADELGPGAIRVFKQYLEHYAEDKHNGVSLVPKRTAWLEQLTASILNYTDLHEMLLISNTTTKLYPLIVPAVGKGLTVKVYNRHPELLLATHEKLRAESLATELRNEIRNDAHVQGGVELYHFRHLPTFRAALIGDAVLGIEMYIHRDDVDEGPETSSTQASSGSMTGHPVVQKMVPSRLRLIVTRYSSQFVRLKEDLIDRFLNCKGVDKKPYTVVGNSGSGAKGAGVH